MPVLGLGGAALDTPGTNGASVVEPGTNGAPEGWPAA